MVAQVILHSYSLLNESFSYTVPAHLSQIVRAGVLVLVPFRNKQERAVVLETEEDKDQPGLKTILEVLNPEPVLLPYQIQLARWIADYYLCPLFKAVNLFLPHFVWEEKQDAWVEREIAVGKVTGATGKSDKEKKILDAIPESKTLPWQHLKNAVSNVTLPYLKGLEKKGLVTLTYGEVIPPYFKSYHLDNIAVVEAKGLKTLTVAQQNVLTAIQKNPGKTFLIHGITGSGKTEVYLQAAYQNFRQQKQTLILVPEIALTPQLIAYFFQVFGKTISVLHSRLSDGERFTEWVRIKQRESYVVIGSRSALFSPFPNLGTIVLDEEHEWTYKNDQNPRYHARTVAIETAKLTGATVILGSATPDVESYYQAAQGEYVLLELPEKIAGKK